MEIPGRRLRLLRKRILSRLVFVTRTRTLLSSMRFPPSSTAPMSHYSWVQSPSTVGSLSPPLSSRVILRAHARSRESPIGYLSDSSLAADQPVRAFATPAHRFPLSRLRYLFVSPSFRVTLHRVVVAR